MINMGVTCFSVIYGVSGESMEREVRNFIGQKRQFITKWGKGSVLVNMKKMTSQEKNIKWLYGKKKNQSEFASLDVLEYSIYPVKEEEEEGKNYDRSYNFDKESKRAARCTKVY